MAKQKPNQLVPRNQTFSSWLSRLPTLETWVCLNVNSQQRT